MIFHITETCEYEVEAATEAEAEAIFLDKNDEAGEPGSPIAFYGVTDRQVYPAEQTHTEYYTEGEVAR